MIPIPPKNLPQEPRADGVSWSPCPGSSNDAIQCGYLEAPLDWANESAGKARLALAKYGATNSPRKGVLLSNPGPPSSVFFSDPLTRHTGGPGESGIDLIAGYGQLMSNLTGGYYDIVSWDPRGVGYTTSVFTPRVIVCTPFAHSSIQSRPDQLFQLLRRIR